MAKRRIKGKPVRKKRKKGFTGLGGRLKALGSSCLKASCLVIGVAMISLLFVFLYEYLVKSPYMRLDEVVVKGVGEELKEEVLRLTELKADSSLLALNMDQLKRRIEKHPWIRTVDLEKRFPRTLVIHAEKEEPRAIVASDNLYYMNRQGVVFARVDQAGELDYPVVTGGPQNPLGSKERLDWAVNVLNILEKEKGPWSLEDLAEVHLGEERQISLYFSSLPVVKIRRGELRKRIDDLKKVIDHLQDTGRIHMVKGINMNYQDGAVVSYKNS